MTVQAVAWHGYGLVRSDRGSTPRLVLSIPAVGGIDAVQGHADARDGSDAPESPFLPEVAGQRWAPTREVAEDTVWWSALSPRETEGTDDRF